MIETTTGLIVRTRPLTDTSLIVHWLTPDLGRIATVAKGARRGKSPFAGKLDLFYVARFSFQRSRKSELHQLREVSLQETHAEIRKDLERLRQASYCAALVDHATEPDTPVGEIYALLKETLTDMARQEPSGQLVLAFELKLLVELGLQPDMQTEKLAPDIKRIVELLQGGTGEAISRLKLTPKQFGAVERFVGGHLEYHLDRVPANRARAIGGRAEA